MKTRTQRPKTPRRVDGDTFKDARLIGAMSVEQAAAQLGVTRRTIQNWEAGRTRVPYSTYSLLRILSGYALPGKAWTGWSIRGDILWSSEGKPFYAHELNWWGLTVAMARAFRQQRAAEAAAAAAEPADCYAEKSQVRVAQATVGGNPQGAAAGLSPPERRKVCGNSRNG